MPVIKRRKIGEVYEVKKEPTFLEKVGEFLGGVVVFIIIVGVLITAFT